MPPKMPHNNRVSSSSALRTNDMWSKTIGHNPYAAEGEGQMDAELAAQAESVMQIVKMSNLSGGEARGGCKRCGQVGHLTFQCRNPIVTLGAGIDSGSGSDSDSDSSSSRCSPPSLTRSGMYADGGAAGSASQSASRTGTRQSIGGDSGDDACHRSSDRRSRGGEKKGKEKKRAHKHSKKNKHSSKEHKRGSDRDRDRDRKLQKKLKKSSNSHKEVDHGDKHRHRKSKS